MHNGPSLQELAEAVKRFVDEAAAPNLTGQAKFHARVASNVLATMLRELEQRPSAERDEAMRLAALLDADVSLGADALNARLCDEIKAGRIDLSRPGLFEHLKTTAIAQLNIDQPGYSGLRTALERLE